MTEEPRTGFVFHHPLRSVVVHQAERALMSTLASALMDWAVDTDVAIGDVTVSANGVPQTLVDGDDLKVAFSGYIELGQQLLDWDGNPIDAIDFCCNTMSATGSPLFAALARLQAFCEQHVYVEAQDVPWFMELIQHARATNVLRPDQGWEDLLDLCADVIADASTMPIVTSWSFTQSFPYPTPASPDAPTDLEAWSQLAPQEQWQRAVDAIRTQADRLRLTPALPNARLGNGKSAFDLGVYSAQREHARLMRLHEERLHAAPDRT